MGKQIQHLGLSDRGEIPIQSQKNRARLTAARSAGPEKRRIPQNLTSVTQA
jgi:hypothetical protein